MFSKQVKSNTPSRVALPAPMPMDGARKSPKVASVISEDLTVNGGLSSEGEVHVDGRVLGDLKVARLTLGETGHIEGSVTADSIEIRGKVVGPITAKLVRMFSTAHVDGDVTHEQLAMEAGAFFQGRSLKMQRPAQASGVIPLQQPSAASAG